MYYKGLKTHFKSRTKELETNNTDYCITLTARPIMKTDKNPFKVRLITNIIGSTSRKTSQENKSRKTEY